MLEARGATHGVVGILLPVKAPEDFFPGLLQPLVVPGIPWIVGDSLSLASFSIWYVTSKTLELTETSHCLDSHPKSLVSSWQNWPLGKELPIY